MSYADVPSLLVEIPRAELDRLRAIEAAVKAWLEAEAALLLSRKVSPEADRALLWNDAAIARAALLKLVMP